MSTALVGLMGALIALACDTSQGLETLLMYILPFTAGGFLNIALVSIVPDLMQVKVFILKVRKTKIMTKSQIKQYTLVTKRP